MQNLNEIISNVVGYLLSGAVFTVISIYLTVLKLKKDMRRAFIRIKALEEKSRGV